MSIQILSIFWDIHTMEGYLALKRNKTQQTMNHTGIFLNKRNQTQKSTCCIIALT